MTKKLTKAKIKEINKEIKRHGDAAKNGDVKPLIKLIDFMGWKRPRGLKRRLDTIAKKPNVEMSEKDKLNLTVVLAKMVTDPRNAELVGAFEACERYLQEYKLREHKS